MTRTLLGFVACSTLLLLAGSARAATFTVTNTNDTGAGSLRQAVADANGTPGDDEIVFGASLAGQTIVLLTNDATGTPLFGSTALFVSEAAASLTVQGSAAPGLTISGQSARRIFAVQTGATLRLENLTLTNGRIDGGAGGDGDGAGGGAAGMGGGVYAHSGSTLLVLGCTITNCTARGGNGGAGTGVGGGGGGGGWAGAGSPNATTTGGAGGAPNGGAPGAPGGVGGVGGGGAGGNEVASPANAQGGVGGFGGGGGGAGGVTGGPGAGFSAGQSGGFGGGGGGRGLAATLTSTAGGSTIFGGGTGGTGTTLTDRGGGGGGAGMGAGIFSNAGTLNVVNSTFNGNVALGGSGGAGNVAGANGGGGQGLGGGIFVLDGTTRIVGCTFANCGAPQGGAAVYIRGEGGAANVTFENSIAADRGAGPTEVAASSNGTPGSVVANGSGNVIEASAGVPALVATTVDPALGALASNGGPTQTHALGSTSSAKAIGVAATCAAAFPTGSGGVDQRGAPRTSCDAGAYEAGTGTIVILSGTPQSALIGQAFATALRVRVLDGAGAPQVGVAVTFGVPGSGASATIATSPATTNAAGEATVTATANATAGVYSVIASVPSGANAVFTLTNLAVILEKVSGDSQAATLNMDFALPLVVRVRNASGTPLAGQTVTFSAPGGGASATFAPTTVVTDASGLASTTATANGTGGDFNATASTSGAVVTFSLTNRGRGGTDSILRTRRIVIKGKDCALAPGDTGPGSALWLLALAGLLLGLRRRS